MRLFFLLLTIFSFHTQAEYIGLDEFRPKKSWVAHSNNERKNIRHLIITLAKSKTGKALLLEAKKKAEKEDKTLLDIVAEGHGSLTDTTLIRRFTTGNPDHITYETTSKVFINRDLNQYDALLDLAHELTHYVYRTNFNPYQKNFDLGEFIKNTVEGQGGEVQAFIMECTIHRELFPKDFGNRHNCKKIIDEKSGKFSFAKAVKSFYKVGDYFESFVSVLNKHGLMEKFPDVNADQVSFISSAYGIPYPVAAFEEYISVLNKVCENDKKRIGYFKEKSGRSPASIQKFEKDYLARCQTTFN